MRKLRFSAKFANAGGLKIRAMREIDGRGGQPEEIMFDFEENCTPPIEKNAAM